MKNRKEAWYKYIRGTNQGGRTMEQNRTSDLINRLEVDSNLKEQLLTEFDLGPTELDARITAGIAWC